MRRVLTVREAAEFLTVSPYTIRAWIRERRLGYAKLGRSIRIPVEELERVMVEGFRPAEGQWPEDVMRTSKDPQ